MTTSNCFLSLDDAYKWIAGTILRHGEDVAPRSIPTKELRALSISILDPRRRYISLAPRRWSLAYALGEFCWHVRGSNRLDEINFYSRRWDQMSEDGVTVPGSCYGHNIFSERANERSQWQTAVRALQSDYASRRAILFFNNVLHENYNETRDLNCATSLQFFARDGKLEAIATMRSNDVFLGLPYDVFLFTMLQELMCTKLNLQIGTYYHNVGSMHIYSSDLERILEIQKAHSSVEGPMPSMVTTVGIDELLNGEIRTRHDIETLDADFANDYWGDLLSVLRYRNAVVHSHEVRVENIVRNEMFRQLIALRLP